MSLSVVVYYAFLNFRIRLLILPDFIFLVRSFFNTEYKLRIRELQPVFRRHHSKNTYGGVEV